MKSPRKKAGSGAEGRGGGASDKRALVGGEIGGARVGKKKRREAYGHEDPDPVYATTQNGSTLPDPDASGQMRAVALADERAAFAGRLRAELELALQEQRHIEDSLTALAEFEQSRIGELSSRLLEAESQVELVNDALRSEREQLSYAEIKLAETASHAGALATELAGERERRVELARQVDETNARMGEVQLALESQTAALTESQAQLAAAEARELSAQRALEQAERTGAAAKEQIADAQALLSRERQRTAELTDAVAAIENMRGAERQRMAELTARTADADRQRQAEAGKNAALEKALSREEAANAAAQRRADQAEVEIREMVAQASHREQAVQRREREVGALLASTSWRLTEPWREFKRMTSRLLRLLRGKTTNPLFDRDWYLRQYPDVRASESDPYAHYLRHGALEGRDPHPGFDTDWYLQQNPDVRASGLNPLVHFYLHGAAEGRDPHPLLSNSRFLEQYPVLRSKSGATGTRPFAKDERGSGRQERP